MNIILLSVVACVIIAGLAAYAGYLLFQLKQQKKLQAHHRAIAIEKRNANIFESVNVLCITGNQHASNTRWYFAKFSFFLLAAVNPHHGFYAVRGISAAYAHS